MRRLQLGTLTLALSAFVAAATLVGCGGGSNKEETANNAETTKPPKKGKKGSGEKKTPVASGSGSLKGRVVMDGPKPDLAAMNATLIGLISKKADDKQNCLAGASELEKEQQEWRISDSGGLANVFVYLRPAEGTYFELTSDSPGVKAVKGKDVIIDQPHCAFIPHAVALFPSYTDAKSKKKVETGQKLVVKNNAKMPHNTKYSGQDQEGGNPTIPPGKEIQVTDLKPSATEVTLQCGIHPWMSGVARVFDHPYFAITDKDGNFEIKNVPNGDVNVVVWHEGAKYINSGGAKGDKITLNDSVTTKDFKATAPSK